MFTRKVKFKQICPVKTKPKYYLIAVLMTFGLMMIGVIASSILLRILTFFGYETGEGFLPDLTGYNIIPAIFFMAVVPAFFEELLFRGLILHCTEQSMGGVRAILVTGFCFALMHGSPQQTIHQFLLGCAIAFITIRSGSVLPGMLMHFLNNFIALLFSLLVDVEMNEAFTYLFGYAVLASIGLAAGMFAWLVCEKNKPMIKCSKGGVKVFFIAAALGIAIMSVMWLLDLFNVM